MVFSQSETASQGPDHVNKNNVARICEEETKPVLSKSKDGTPPPAWIWQGDTSRKNLLVAVGLGQVLSILICGTAVTSGLLQQQNVIIPTAQSFLNYALLFLIFTTLLSCRRGEGNILHVLKERGWKYFLLSLVDVESNYLIVKAYHYTTVTSVQLLDCFTIPTVLVLSWLFLRVRYQLLHVLGVGFCLLGVGLLVGADLMVDRWKGDGPNKVLGDMLCLAGAALYGISNVGQEVVVRNFSAVEFLGMMGLFGSLINGIQFAIMEREEILQVDWQSYKVLLPLLGFALCLFFLYALMPIAMKLTSATAVNLNILSADFYALLVGLFLFHYKFHYMYFISFGAIILGVVVYSLRPPPVVSSTGELYSVMQTTAESPSLPESQGDTHSEITYHSQGNGDLDSCRINITRFINPHPADDQHQLMQHQDHIAVPTQEPNGRS